MARAPETGFYFEPVAERLALLLEGSPFPSEEAWAYIRAPGGMPRPLTRLEAATRWPGVDPETLELELDFDPATSRES